MASVLTQFDNLLMKISYLLNFEGQVIFRAKRKVIVPSIEVNLHLKEVWRSSSNLCSVYS